MPVLPSVITGPREKANGPGAVILDFGMGLALVALATVAGSLLAPSWGNSAVDLLYLPAVLGAAIIGGLRPALLSAVIAAIAFNFFFTAPRHTFRIDNPVDVVTVAILLLVAVVASQLAASVRKQAQVAQARAARDATIAALAGALLSSTNEQRIAEVTTGHLAALFRCRAVLVTGSPKLRMLSSAPSKVRVRASDLTAAQQALTPAHHAGSREARVKVAEWQFHPVRYDQVLIAMVGLAPEADYDQNSEDQLSLLRDLLAQVAMALERARLEHSARELAALRERDRIRASVLSTIAQDLRPRVGKIVATVAELRRTGSGEKALVSTIGNETLRLDQYISGLMNLGLDADQQPIESKGVTIDLFHRTVTKEGRKVRLTPKEYAIIAELAKHPGRVLSHQHLLRTVWGPAQESRTEYLRVAVGGLRQKLERQPKNPQLIVNEPAVGYRLALS